MFHLSLKDIDDAAKRLHELLYATLGAQADGYKLYGVPRGGISAALAIGNHSNIQLVADPTEADAIVDDLIDSGATMMRYKALYPDIPFLALYDKSTMGKEVWLVFPWEVGESGQGESFDDNVVRLLQYVGEDSGREGLLETPARVSKAWKHWCGGYKVDIPALLKVFEDGADGYNEMVTVKDIPIYSHCEHHLAAIFGTCTISYIPDGKIVGLSKLSRLVDAYARRLQVQERLTSQIANALQEHLEPIGVGVLIKARHLCMESRGVCQQGHHTITTALRGAILNEPATRAEFLDMSR